ncbi:MAG: 8-oxo-dGTP diphosphatase MutT [Candidatus Omnitrophica bacterium]|nr:8-oxo-dGTP diphosphatase MutT [Candidatus Omnitrophota bacterium]
MTKRIDAAIAIIERRGSILICQRHEQDSFGGFWEFPGGKREAGESWEACLRREVKEELGVNVRAVSLFGRMSYRYPDGIVSFRVYRCAIARGNPHPLDAQALRWVSRARLCQYRFPPANDPLVAYILKDQARGERAVVDGFRPCYTADGPNAARMP